MPSYVCRSIWLLFCCAAGAGCAGLQTSTAERNENSAEQERRQAIATEFDSHRDQAQLQAAIARWQAHDAIGCKRQLGELLARRPDHQQARLLWAELLLAEGNVDEGLTAVERIVQENPTQASAQHLLGLALEARGQLQRALPHYREASRLEADNPIYRTTYESALASAEPSRVIQRADSPFGEALSTATTSRGQAAPRSVRIGQPGPARLDDPQAGAVVLAAAATQADSDWTGAERSLSAGHLDQGRQCLRAYLAANPDPQQAVAAGLLALRYGQPGLAVELLAPAQTEFPSSAAVARTLGTAHYRGGDYTAARQAFEASIALDNSHGLSYFLLGCTLARLGQEDSARARFAEARKLDPRLDSEPALERSR